MGLHRCKLLSLTRWLARWMQKWKSGFFLFDSSSLIILYDHLISISRHPFPAGQYETLMIWNYLVSFLLPTMGMSAFQMGLVLLSTVPPLPELNAKKKILGKNTAMHANKRTANEGLRTFAWICIRYLWEHHAHLITSVASDERKEGHFSLCTLCISWILNHVMILSIQNWRNNGLKNGMLYSCK